MSNFIKSKAEWQTLYQKDKNNVWFYVVLSNNETIYLRNYREWLPLKEYCESNKFNIQAIKMRYRSHTVNVDTKNAEAVYLVQSLLGSLTSSTKKTITVGILSGDKVKKTIWMTPELIEYMTEYDNVDKCFKEALIYNNGTQEQ